MTPGRALVMGLGSFGGGEGAVRHLAARGYAVTVTDLRPAAALEEPLERLGDLELTWTLGEHRPEDFEAAELVCVNPAVAPSSPWVRRARRGGARITSEIELFLEAVEARLFCISGTQGKSSTSHILAQLLEASGFRVHLGGNIGGSLLPRLGEIAADDVCVLELSSYQLEALSPTLVETLRGVEAVCLTNVLADHLERHGSLEAYAGAKRRLFELANEDTHVLFPADDPRIGGWATRGIAVPFSARPVAEGSSGGLRLQLADGAFRRRCGELDEDLGSVAKLPLRGRFQEQNTLCALGMARRAGASPEALRTAVPLLHGLPHRMEDLGVRGGRRIYDNAVSTTPDSTIAALRELDRGATLLVGGKKKDLPFDELAHLAAAKEALCIAFGAAREALAGELVPRGVRVLEARDVEEALALALEHTPEGGEILFSPACASFDAYPNFQARAKALRAALPPPDEGASR